MSDNAGGPAVSSTRLLDDLWSFLCDCENAGERTRRTALTVASQNHGEGEYRLARDVKHRMIILGYKPSSNARPVRTDGPQRDSGTHEAVVGRGES